jgi:hypothetical protein
MAAACEASASTDGCITEAAIAKTGAMTELNGIDTMEPMLASVAALAAVLSTKCAPDGEDVPE